MPGVEVSREDVGQTTVFVAMPTTMPPMRYVHLLYAALLEGGFIATAELVLEPTASMLRWLGALCAIPVILLWVVTLLRTAQRGAVRLTVAPEGLLAYGQLFPHDTIRDLALYAPGGRRPLFVAHIAMASSWEHKSELNLVTGTVDVEKEPGRWTKGTARKNGFRLVMHRRGHLPAIVLVRGLTLSGGETLFAGLAAELRKHSRHPRSR